MRRLYFGIAVCSVCIASLSQILLKKGAEKTYNTKIREYCNGYVAGGYGMLLISMLLTIVAYRYLSYFSVPVAEALGYVLVPLFSRLFFHEKISMKKAMGITLILVGVLLYNLS